MPVALCGSVPPPRMFAVLDRVSGSARGLFEFRIDRCDCLLSASVQDALDEGQECVFGQDTLGVREHLGWSWRDTCAVGPPALRFYAIIHRTTDNVFRADLSSPSTTPWHTYIGSPWSREIIPNRKTRIMVEGRKREAKGARGRQEGRGWLPQNAPHSHISNAT